MGKSYLQRFSNPEFFFSIREDHLRALFKRTYSVYLGSRGLDLGAPLDVRKLSSLLAHPTAAMPNEMIDDLYHIQEMSAPGHFDALVDAATRAGMQLERNDKTAPADVATQIFLLDPKFLVRQHVRSHTSKRRLFEVFWGPTGVAQTQFLSSRFADLEWALRDWLEKHGNGHMLKLFFDRPDERLRLIVQHGGLVKRTGAVENGEPSSHIYRPLVFDVIWFDPHRGELMLNMGTDRPREKQMYLAEFGRFFYNSQFYFTPAVSKYTLEPLRSEGATSLICADVPEIQKATLREIVFDAGGPEGEVRIARSDDLFRVFARRNEEFPPNPMVSARLEFTLARDKGKRMVEIRTGNQLSVGRRDDIEWINRFLVQRRFCCDWRASSDDVLASA